MATLYSCANLSMIHQVTAPATFSGESPKAAPSRDLTPLSPTIKLTLKWKDQIRGLMDRCTHASSIVRITHSLQRVVCTLCLGSKSRTTVLGSAKQNKAPQSRWPSIHASLSFHLRFSLSSSAASIHLQLFQNQYLPPGIIPRPYNSS